MVEQFIMPVRSDESLASCVRAVRTVRAVPLHVFKQVEIVLDSVTVKERWLIAPVTVLGKLYNQVGQLVVMRRNNLTYNLMGSVCQCKRSKTAYVCEMTSGCLASENSSLQGESNRFLVRTVNSYGHCGQGQLIQPVCA